MLGVCVEEKSLGDTPFPIGRTAGMQELQQHSMVVTSFNPWIPLVDVRPPLVLRAFGFFELFCSPSAAEAMQTYSIRYPNNAHSVEI
jgi:hypothetical protein